jgi:hypothetical protein
MVGSACIGVALCVTVLCAVLVHAVSEVDGSINAASNSGKVAFVFAGSPRTFVHPLLFKSLKKNLIESFCPRDVCEPHVFARLSFMDNVHEGVRYSSVGITLPRTDKEEFIIDKVRKLAERVTIQVVDIGSKEENDEMVALGRNRSLHQIYRELDPRRYSMYFHRWSSYQMVIQAEKDGGFLFEWVVHARMDFFFGAPVKPYNLYSKIMWAVDQWSYNVPDVFALLPRRFSDVWYSIEEMYAENRVPCLGGPDFHSSFVTDEALTQRGYTSELKALVKRELCLNKYPNKGRSVFDRGTGVEWSLFGVSEEWLLRKLNFRGIDFQKKTLGYTTFFTIMSREGPSLTFFCLNTRPNSFIGWVRNTQHSPLAMAHACFTLEAELKLLQERRRPGANSSIYGPNCDYNTFVTAENASDEPQSMCIIDEAVTELNFLPYRILTEAGECLTVTNLFNKGMQALPSVFQCNATSQLRDVTMDYHISQMFNFYPLAKEPQKISNFQFLDDRRFRSCLSVVPGAAAGDYKLAMLRCMDRPDQSQLFRVVLLDSASTGQSIVMPPENSIKTFEDNTLAMLKWVGEEETYCVSIRSFRAAIKVGLGLCQPTNPKIRIPVFSLERTKLMGPTSAIR